MKRASLNLGYHQARPSTRRHIANTSRDSNKVIDCIMYESIGNDKISDKVVF